MELKATNFLNSFQETDNNVLTEGLSAAIFVANIIPASTSGIDVTTP